MGSVGGSGSADMGAISASTINASGNISTSGNISATSGTGTFKKLKINETSTFTGKITAGEISASNLAASGTLSVNDVATFKKSIILSSNGKNLTINWSSLTQDKSAAYTELTVQEIAVGETIMKVLVLPSDSTVTTGWIPCSTD